jgi:hypothetical protein
LSKILIEKIIGQNLSTLHGLNVMRFSLKYSWADLVLGDEIGNLDFLFYTNVRPKRVKSRKGLKAAFNPLTIHQIHSD